MQRDKNTAVKKESMSKEMELYEVNLPDDFDYKGLVPNLSGTVHASSPRQAVRFFVMGKRGEDNVPIYNELKGHVETTEPFAKKVVKVIAEHYARKYWGNPEYAERLGNILQVVGVDLELIDSISALADTLEMHYKSKWVTERQLRGAYGHVKKQEAKLAAS